MPWQPDCHTSDPHSPSAAGKAASVQPCLDVFVPEGIRPLKNVSLLCLEVMQGLLPPSHAPSL